MKKILLLLILLFPCTKIFAYENEYFKIDIPDNYIMEENNNSFKFTNNDYYILINISNNDNKLNISKFNNQDIDDQKEYISSSINNQLNKYNVKVDIYFDKKDNINNNDTIIYNLYWPTKEIIGNDYFQKEYIFTTSNYIITVLINDVTDVNDEIINSFVINDGSINTEFSIYTFYISLFIIIFLLIIFIIEKEFKKKHN